MFCEQDNGMTFLSNMFIDTRPCEKEEYYALPMILEESFATAAPVVAETAAPVELDNQGTRGEVYGLYSLFKQ